MEFLQSFDKMIRAVKSTDLSAIDLLTAGYWVHVKGQTVDALNHYISAQLVWPFEKTRQ